MSDVLVWTTEETDPIVLAEGKHPRYFGSGGVSKFDVSLLAEGQRPEECDLGARAFSVGARAIGIEVAVMAGNRHWVLAYDHKSGAPVARLKPEPDRDVVEIVDSEEIEICVETPTALYRVVARTAEPLEHRVRRRRRTPDPSAGVWNLSERTHRIVIANCARALAKQPGVTTHADVAALLAAGPFEEDRALNEDYARQLWKRARSYVVELMGSAASAVPSTADAEEFRAAAIDWLVRTGRVNDTLLAQMTRPGTLSKPPAGGVSAGEAHGAPAPSAEVEWS